MALPHATLWGTIVAFAGFAAFFGILMNSNYLLAGSVSVNPILLILCFFLVLAWKTVGWWGLDRWLLPVLETPWRPGRIFYGTKHNGSLTLSTQH